MQTKQMTNNPDIKLSTQSSPHTKRIELKIKELQQLKSGWDFGGGDIISDQVAEASLRIAEHGLLLGLNANVRPSVDGSIIVSLFHNDRFLFISVRNDDLYDVVYEKGIGMDYEILDCKEDMDFTSTKEYISRWVLSEHYTSENMTRMLGGLLVMPLENTRMGGYLYSMNNVRDSQVGIHYATTSSDFITRQLEPQYATAR